MRGDGGSAGVEGRARGGGDVGFERRDPALDLLARGLLRLGGGERWEECGNEGEAHGGGDGRIGLRSRELGLKRGFLVEDDELEKVKEYGEYTKKVGARDEIEGNGARFRFTFLYQQSTLFVGGSILYIYNKN